MLAALVVLAAASKSKTSTSGSYGFLIVIVLIFAVMYFLVIRPRNQKLRQQRDLTQKAGVGDTVVTVGGLVGTIVSEDGDKVTLSTGNGTELVYVRQAIGRRLQEAATPAEPAAEAGFSGPPPGFDSDNHSTDGEPKEQPPT